MPTQLTDYAANANLPASSLDFDNDLIEGTHLDQGPFIVTGLTLSIGSGLSVVIATGRALIGMRVTVSVAITVSGLAPSTTNHIYLLRNGTATSNTTGTAPADSVKIGTALTGASTVTSVAQNWASGRQALVRSDQIVMGGGAGHPGAVDLASWHATNDEGAETKGTLPVGALPTGGSNNAQSTKTTNYTATAADYYLWVDCTGGAVTITLPTAVGAGGKTFVIKKIDSTANAVTIATTSSQTIDGVTTQTITTQWASFSVASNNANWYIF